MIGPNREVAGHTARLWYPPVRTPKYASLVLDHGGWVDFGQITLSPLDGRAKFILTTAGLGDGGSWFSIKVKDADDEGPLWRVDSCSVEYL